MKPPLKPVAEHVIVITGASSGIGLATAMAAARQGAALVLAARSKQTLDSIAAQLASEGAQVAAVEGRTSATGRRSNASPAWRSNVSAASTRG